MRKISSCQRRPATTRWQLKNARAAKGGAPEAGPAVAIRPRKAESGSNWGEAKSPILRPLPPLVAAGGRCARPNRRARPARPPRLANAAIGRGPRHRRSAAADARLAVFPGRRAVPRPRADRTGPAASSTARRPLGGKPRARQSGPAWRPRSRSGANHSTSVPRRKPAAGSNQSTAGQPVVTAPSAVRWCRPSIRRTSAVSRSTMSAVVCVGTGSRMLALPPITLVYTRTLISTTAKQERANG